jgi:hypothetical protein
VSATLAVGPDSGLVTLTATGPLVLAIAACVAAGLVSFASPCCLPLVPGYVSYLAAAAGPPAPASPGSPVRPAVAGRWRMTVAAALFVAGFTVVFVAATASVFGVIDVLALNRTVLQRIGGIVTIVMGLAFVGLIPALQRDTRLTPRRVSTLAGAPPLWRGVRIGVDTVPGSHLDWGVVGGRRYRGHHRRPWGGFDRRLLPGFGRSLCRPGVRVDEGMDRDRLAPPPFPPPADLWRNRVDHGGDRVGDRGVGAFH